MGVAIGGSGTLYLPTGSQALHSKRAVIGGAKAQGQVDPVANDIDMAVRQDELNPDSGMLV